MAAGLTKKQISDRIYRRLQTIRLQLAAAGVDCKYVRGGYLIYQEPPEGVRRGPGPFGFHIAFTVLRASNGEVCGSPRLQLNEFHVKWLDKNLYTGTQFKAGIMRLIELHAAPALSPEQAQAEVAQLNAEYQREVAQEVLAGQVDAGAEVD